MNRAKMLRDVVFATAYAELVNRVQSQKADIGLLGYYLFFSGSIDSLSPYGAMGTFKELYRKELGDSNLTDSLTTFGRMCIMQNLTSHTRLILSRASKILDLSRKVSFEGPLAHIPSNTTFELAAHYAKSSYAQPIGDNIDSLTGGIMWDMSTGSRKTTIEQMPTEGMRCLIEVLTQWQDSLRRMLMTSHPPATMIAQANAVFKASIALTAGLFGMTPDEITSERFALASGGDQYSSGTLPAISDMTLAALPRPMPELIELCKNEAGVSINGILYMKAYKQLVSMQ